MALTTTSVAEALNNVTIDPTGMKSDIQQLKSTKITANADGSYTIGENSAFIGNEPGAGTVIKYLGTIKLTAGGTSSAAITAEINGSPQTLIVLGFNGTQVLVEGVTATSAGTYTVNTNRYLITSGPPDTAIQIGNANPGTVTVDPTGNSYTAPNGSTIPCFARGTLIKVPGGQKRIEDIAVGHYVLNKDGKRRKVTWIGSRDVDIEHHPKPETVRPVVIRKNALGRARPSRDLVVSPDHNLFLDGVLIPAKCLVNGRNVVMSELARVTYHHIELLEHDVVVAENLPAETYLDTGNRTAFAEGPVVDAFPDFSSAPDLNYFAWEARGCAPLVLAGPAVDAVRARLDANADKAEGAVLAWKTSARKPAAAKVPAAKEAQPGASQPDASERAASRRSGKGRAAA